MHSHMHKVVKRKQILLKIVYVSKPSANTNSTTSAEANTNAEWRATFRFLAGRSASKNTIINLCVYLCLSVHTCAFSAIYICMHGRYTHIPVKVWLVCASEWKSANACVQIWNAFIFLFLFHFISVKFLLLLLDAKFGRYYLHLVPGVLVFCFCFPAAM